MSTLSPGSGSVKFLYRGSSSPAPFPTVFFGREPLAMCWPDLSEEFCTSRMKYPRHSVQEILRSGIAGSEGETTFGCVEKLLFSGMAVPFCVPVSDA